MTLLAVPIAGRDLVQVKQQIKAALATGAEIIELRTDYIEQLSADLVTNLVSEYKQLKKSRHIPVIVTCRDIKQGGIIDYPEHLRVEVLVGALKAGADYIDFEYDNYISISNQEKIRLALSKSPKARLILSAHNFDTKFQNMRKLFRSISNICPGVIPKLVYKANHINDCFEALDLLEQTSGERIIFCIGQAGLISRILAKKLGSFVTFACLDTEKSTASGQLTIEEFKKLYRYDNIDSETQLFGVIADPVGHSLSPAIHNGCFDESNMNRLYLPLLIQGDQQQFETFMNNILLRKWLNFRGFSVTIPHKRNALTYTRSHNGYIEPLAEKIGAINTLIISRDGKVKAYNTDYTAALDAITTGMKITSADLKGLNVAVVGAGGVARALVAGLSDAGSMITIYNRTVEKAERLANEFDCQYAPLRDLSNLKVKLLVNCTSIGMNPNIDASPVAKEHIKKGMTVFDTVYNPAETLLLKYAKAKRIKRIDGVSMFINQAMAQFKLFTGTEPNSELMREKLVNSLQKK